jgi:hypothetical protein
VIISLIPKIKKNIGKQGFLQFGRTFIRDVARFVIQPVTTFKYTCHRLNDANNGRKDKLNWKK